MGRLREKISPSLREALEKLAENAEILPDVDSPHFLPRWDFSQSRDKITITIYAKNPDPTFSYCEELENGGYVIMGCFGWYKRIISLTITDLYEAILPETGLLNMTANKIEVSFKKARVSEITWPQLYLEDKPEMKQEGIMNPVPPPTITQSNGKQKNGKGPAETGQLKPKQKTKEQIILDELRSKR